MKIKMSIKEIKQIRKASEDLECSLKFVTEDTQIMALSAYPSYTVFNVTIEAEKES